PSTDSRRGLMDPLTPPLPTYARLDTPRGLDARSTAAHAEALLRDADDARRRLHAANGSAREAMRT
ncbi:hypothetical protein, partial [Microbacterium sp.]|uniref:hypothetical protein n=2 Tax=Microbacterium sp. TaxID=51671 RepID=UPI003F9C8BFB